MAKEITSKNENYSQWYNDIVIKAGLADYSAVRGCMVIKPYGYAIWEKIQRQLDAMFKATGHQNAYFPLFIPKSFFSKEASHVEGFAKECAIVTHYRLKNDPNGNGVIVDPEAELEEELIVRPTSETIIWNTYRNWIQSYRDLPILINQWANVVRWEMRPRAFLRTTEFLWQEGHTAHATEAEARAETMRMLGVYRDFAHENAAIPVIPGRKTDREKFAGAVETYSIEAMMGNGWALQSGTSHYLGTNFAKAFNTRYLDENNEQQFVHQSSWGVSTRLVGAVIMVHGDDSGLRLPPDLAPVQVVLVPIHKTDSEREQVMSAACRIRDELAGAGVRVRLDDRTTVSPGFKFNHWEVRGVPLRFELGPRDLASRVVTGSARNRPGRDAKFTIGFDSLLAETTAKLRTIQDELLDEARSRQDSMTWEAATYDEFKARFESESGFCQVWWNGSSEDEERLQQETKATIRCIPLDQEPGEGPCFMTGGKAVHRAIVARAY